MQKLLIKFFCVLMLVLIKVSGLHAEVELQELFKQYDQELRSVGYSPQETFLAYFREKRNAKTQEEFTNIDYKYLKESWRKTKGTTIYFQGLDDLKKDIPDPTRLRLIEETYEADNLAFLDFSDTANPDVHVSGYVIKEEGVWHIRDFMKMVIPAVESGK